LKLHTVLQEHLKQKRAWITEEGKLKKWVVIALARNGDPDLIALLLNHPKLKEAFFLSVDEALVFQHEKFITFLEMKNYLNDSYTRYSNSIGLATEDRRLKHVSDVVLVWPFKDCILEGGQTKAEQKREEVFFNRILAHDEITQLLEPKVVTHATLYDAEGQHPLETFRRDRELNRKRGVSDDTITDNLIIKGNNLLAMHSLKNLFGSKVKLIYIDPPYNTGSDGFNYNDRFSRSTWLTFMHNRLEIAKTLLRDDGAIFVQCDDNEQAYLKVLMDEVFGRENHRETIVVKTSTPSGVNAINVKRGERLFKVKEYLLFYSKTPTFRFKPMYVKSRFNSNYRYEVVQQGDRYRVRDLKSIYQDAQKLQAYALAHPDRIFSLEKNNKKAGEAIKKVLKASRESDEVIAFVNSHKRTMLIYQGGVLVPLKDRIVHENGRNFFGTLISDLWDDEIFQTNQREGGVHLPGGKKPEKLLKRILELVTEPGDIVLDYHLGSGTTAAVAHKMQRQYIGIEQLDYGQNDSVVRLQKVIAGDPTGISSDQGWHGGGSFVYLELKKQNQTLIEAIMDAKTTDELLGIWERMRSESFLDYAVDVEAIQKSLEDFRRLDLSEQKRILIDLLDANQLYVNLSSLHDADFACSEAEKRITNLLYRPKG
jgi:adenine-specific DNA-methyltransferase